MFCLHTQLYLLCGVEMEITHDNYRKLIVTNYTYLWVGLVWLNHPFKRHTTHKHAHAYTHAHTHAHTHTWTHAHTHANTHPHAQTYIDAHTHTRTHKYSQTHLHAILIDHNASQILRLLSEYLPYQLPFQ